MGCISRMMLLHTNHQFACHIVWKLKMNDNSRIKESIWRPTLHFSSEEFPLTVIAVWNVGMLAIVDAAQSLKIRAAVASTDLFVLVSRSSFWNVTVHGPFEMNQCSESNSSRHSSPLPVFSGGQRSPPSVAVPWHTADASDKVSWLTSELCCRRRHGSVIKVISYGLEERASVPGWSRAFQHKHIASRWHVPHLASGKQWLFP
jgi:hypothetical protein